MAPSDGLQCKKCKKCKKYRWKWKFYADIQYIGIFKLDCFLKFKSNDIILKY